jgi:hypothetical protein
MIKIISAEYGANNWIDVKDIIEKKFTKNEEIRFSVNNDIFTDPDPYITKNLKIVIDDNDTIIEYIAFEGENFIYPKTKYNEYNTLVLTSCNRIDQILFAIAVNKEIIKEDFNLVVADCSTPYKNKEDSISMHKSDDPYNLINEKNYNPNWELIQEYVNTIPKIRDFRIIHLEPRLSKQVGEANLTSLGLNAAALLGSKYAVKLTGVCHLKYDIFEKLKEYIEDNIAATWRRTSFPQKSTRVFACRPDKLNYMFMDAGFSEWIHEYDFLERKFERILNKNIDSINHMDIDERDIIVDEGIGRNDHREILTNNLKKHELITNSDKYIQKFLNGEIW